MAEPPRPPAESAAIAALTESPGFARLLRSLELADGFRFHILAGATPLTVRATRTLLTEKGFAVVTLDPASPNKRIQLGDLEEKVLKPLAHAAAANSRQLFLIDATRAQPSDEPAWRELFRRLNERRNAVARGLRGGLLLAAPESLTSALSQEAADFWSIRSTELTVPHPGASVSTLGPDSEIPIKSGYDIDAAMGEPRDAVLAERAVRSARERLAAGGGNPQLLAALFVELARLAEEMQLQGKSAAALRLRREGLEIAKALAETEPGRVDLLGDLAVAYDKLGDLLAMRGEEKEARRAFEEALSHRHRLVAAEPQRADYRRDLSVSLERMGDLLVTLGEVEDARRFYQDVLDLRRRLAASEPQRTDYQRDLSVSYNKMGDLLATLGERDEARDFYRQDLAIARRLATAEPQRADYQRDLAVTLAKMGTVDSEHVADHAHGALEILQALKQRGALLPGDEPWLRSLQQTLLGG